MKGDARRQHGSVSISLFFDSQGVVAGDQVAVVGDMVREKDLEYELGKPNDALNNHLHHPPSSSSLACLAFLHSGHRRGYNTCDVGYITGHDDRIVRFG